MEQASKAVSRALSSGHSEPRAADSEIPELVAWLWQQLVTMYGSSFLTAYAVNDGPPKLWVAALSKLTAEEAKLGIATLSKEARSYPANLTEILAACRPKKQVRYLGRPVNPRNYLPRPTASDETRQKYLAHMRSLFAKTKRAEASKGDMAMWESPACSCKGAGECETCRRFA